MVNKCSIQHAMITQFFYEPRSVSLKHGFFVSLILQELFTSFFISLLLGMTSESYCTALRCIKALVSFVQVTFLKIILQENKHVNSCINKYSVSTHSDSLCLFVIHLSDRTPKVSEAYCGEAETIAPQQKNLIRI